MINVTKPNLPNIDEYIDILKGIWERNWLTNNGPLVNELEMNLKGYLNLDHLLYLNNGTIAIQIALKALELNVGSEIITTPFSYVATTSSIVWEGYKPVFVDVDASTFNINPKIIEEAITDKTTAILATHVFGNPCDIEAIAKIAEKYNLKVIYDAAHCFGTKYDGKSVFSYGDVSTTSFHATKLFHTIEGGAVFTTNPALLKKMAHMRNFGHDGPEDFECIGINGKNSEFHAAMGICNLRMVTEILASRKELTSFYNNYLKNRLQTVCITTGADFNYAYYPVVFESEEVLLKCVSALNKNYIYPRRYFYPSLNTLKYIDYQVCSNSEAIAKKVLCLPLFYGLRKEDVDFICRILLRSLNY
ncbi:DegT/DnrJ/EryC1/StrS family aminotransferase [Pedobacter sp. JCM 36344]|uniref:DegT/DnrJ/EryC1/StrS family aminotransferase n=1 Tax=Pedobacter sp. JCM 36344 TaxID=3374280 RepID=UPI00397AFFCB